MLAMQQGSEAWHELRRTKIGASDAPVIMGVSPWATPYQLWEEKLGLRERKEANRWMQRGNAMEEHARKAFEAMTGLIMLPCIVTHPDRDWQMASLDGMDFEQEHIVEIKCPGAVDHRKALDGHVPDKYYPQIQHQLSVTELEMAYYFSFDGTEGVVIEVPRDDKYIDKMLKAEWAFYECMETLTPPGLEDMDYEEKTDEDWSYVASEWLKAKQALDDAERKEDQLRSMLITMAKGRNSVGGGVKLSSVYRRGSVDYSKIPELRDVDLDSYRKKSSLSWYLKQV